MSSPDTVTYHVPTRRPSLFSQRRPVTSYVSSYRDLTFPVTQSDTRSGSQETRWKEHPSTGQTLALDHSDNPTDFEATTNNLSMDISETGCPRELSSSHLSSIKQSLQSLARKMSVSLRTRNGNKTVNAFHTSHASQPMSSDQKSVSQLAVMQNKGRPSRWVRSSSVAKRRESSYTLGPYSDRDPPPYSFTSPRPTTNRGPPPIPFDMHTGAAARAAAAAQNEALHHYQRQTLGLKAEVPRLSDLQHDAESGIGIDMPDQREDRPARANLIRQDPAQVLPMEIMEQTLCYLDPRTLLHAELVCRDWRIKARSRHVWRHVFEREYDAASVHGHRSRPWAPEARGVGKAMPDQDWQKMYHLRRQIDHRWAGGHAAAIYLNGHQDSVYCVQFDEQKIVTGSRDRTIRVWDAHTFQCIRKIGPPDYVPRRPPTQKMSRIDPVGAFYIQNTSFVDAFDGATSTQDDHHDASILCLQYDEELMVTGSSDRTAIVWSIRDNYRPIRRLRNHSGGVLDVCLNQDYIVTCSKDSTICVWDRWSGSLIKRLTGHRGPVNAVQMRGHLLASASGDGMAKLWNLRDGLCVKEFASKDRGLACVEFSDDGRFILAGGNDHVIYEYDTNTGDLVRELIGHKGLVRSLHLDFGNNRVISGSYDMSVKVWDGGREVGKGDAGPKINFSGWTTSWMLAAQSDYRKIVCTSQDGRVVIMDFGYGLDGVEMLEA